MCEVDLQRYTKYINDFVLKEFAIIEVKTKMVLKMTVTTTNSLKFILLSPCDWNILTAKNNFMAATKLPWNSKMVPDEAVWTIIHEIFNKHASSM